MDEQPNMPMYNNKMAKISIIVPVYNTEKYIDVCLDSIISQTFKDFEIICIDDGSNDNSSLILENYAKFDKRIKITKTQNNGLSEARNKGLELAAGKYVMFVDSDDWISPVMIERLYQNIKQNQADYVFCNIRAVDTSSNKGYIWELLPQAELENYTKKTFFCEENLSPDLYAKMHTMAWGKLYKREFIKNFKFPKGLIFEDAPFFAQCYLKAARISYDFAPLYYYRIKREDSIISKTNAKYEDIFEINKMVTDIFIENKKYEKYKTHLLIKQMQDVLYRTFMTDGETNKNMFEKIKEEYGNFDFEKYNINLLKRKNIYHLYQKIIKMNYDQFINFQQELKQNEQRA